MEVTGEFNKGRFCGLGWRWMLTGLSLRANEKRGMRESIDDSFKET